jgi:Mrp family chromosome partitioning ATPase
MEQLLTELESRFDLVIVDTPAALAVSDTMPLLSMASGVVLVARINSSTREEIKRLQRVIATANGTIVGVVATATGSGPGYETYEYGYNTNGTAQSRRRWLRRRKRQPSPAATTQAADAGVPSREFSDV